MRECILADGVWHAQKMVVSHRERFRIQAPSRKIHQVPSRGYKLYRTRLSLPGPNQAWERRNKRIIPAHRLEELWMVMLRRLNGRDESALHKVHSVIALLFD